MIDEKKYADVLEERNKKQKEIDDTRNEIENKIR